LGYWARSQGAEPEDQEFSSVLFMALAFFMDWLLNRGQFIRLYHDPLFIHRFMVGLAFRPDYLYGRKNNGR
jgi:hypothetical protein